MRSNADPEASRPDWLKDVFPDREGKGVRVGIVDSGWDWSIADGRVEPGVGLVAEQDDLDVAHSDDTQDRIGHGTMCSDLVLSIAPQVSIVPMRVFGSRLETSAQTLAAAIECAGDLGVDVLNVSISTLRDDVLKTLYLACERASCRGIVIVASAYGRGNLCGAPASFTPVIGVGIGALPYAQFEHCPDEAIEFVASPSCALARGLGGTRCLVAEAPSFAAPTITGIVALLLEKSPGAPVDDVRSELVRLAKSSWNRESRGSGS